MIRVVIVAALVLGGTRAALADLPPDCADARSRPAADPIPIWSRWQWSVGLGAAVDGLPPDWDSTFVVAPQAGFAVWAKDWFCVEYGTGGIFTPPHVWTRWSLSVTGDLVWRPGDGGVNDYRPALRVTRARMVQGLFSVGSLYVPSTDLWLSVGPTFDPSWNGVAVGVGARASVVSLEVRGAVHTGERHSQLLVLVGLTDLHGLLKLGPPRGGQSN